MIRVLSIFGTRPEAIKMAPLVKQLENDNDFDSKICVTGQHRDMLDQVLNLFNINPDYDLNIMKNNQDLYEVTTNVLLGLRNVISQCHPDIVLVHGDTSTSFAASLAAFYAKVKIGHVEAGLRTNDIYSPWPEEANRRITDILANFYFAPTHFAAENLIKENKNKQNIIITGNTVIDALHLMLSYITSDSNMAEKLFNRFFVRYNICSEDKVILVTAHRRENFGIKFENICDALHKIAINNPNIIIFYPVHKNPNIRRSVYRALGHISNIFLLEPLDYEEFIYLMSKSYLVLTDSGGVQEEAPSLGIPVLVLRDTTERQEAVKAGAVKLVGTETDSIVENTQNLLDNSSLYLEMSKSISPYGIGNASQLIIQFIKKHLTHI